MLNLIQMTAIVQKLRESVEKCENELRLLMNVKVSGERVDAIHREFKDVKY